MSELKVAVVDRAHTLYQGGATSVAVPAAEGDLGILPGHQPLLAVLRPGTVRIHQEGGKIQEIPVTAGFVSMDHDAVTVVSEKRLSTSAEESISAN